MGRPKKQAKPAAESDNSQITDQSASEAVTNGEDTGANGTDVVKISKTEAVRRALAEGVTGPTEITEFVKQRFGMQIDVKHVSIIKSQLKKKEGGDQAQARGRKVTSGSGPTWQDIEVVKEMLQRLGAEGVRRLVEVLE